MMTETKAAQGGTTQYRSLYLGLMADAHLRLGEPQTGLGLLHEAERAITWETGLPHVDVRLVHAAVTGASIARPSSLRPEVPAARR
mgnify:CR=1 FL=1